MFQHLLIPELYDFHSFWGERIVLKSIRSHDDFSYQWLLLTQPFSSSLSGCIFTILLCLP